MTRYVVHIGPFSGDYGSPDVVGPFDTEAEAVEWREDAIGAMGWDAHREQIDVLPLIAPEDYR